MNIGFYKTFLSLVMMAVFTACAPSSASAQAAELDESNPLSLILNKASELAQEQDFQKAAETLEQAWAIAELSDQDIFNIHTKLGQYAYELDELATAIEHFENALSGDGISDEDIKNIRLNIGQLTLANGDYAKGAKMLEDLILVYGPDSTLVEYCMQGYVQAEDYKSALPWAEKWFERASHKERKHYDLMNFLYNHLGKRGDQLRIIDAMIVKWPDDRKLWDSKIMLLSISGREVEGFEVVNEMYDRGMITTGRDLEKLAFYRLYYGDEWGASAILAKAYAEGKISSPDLPKITPESEGLDVPHISNLDYGVPARQ